MSRYHLTPNDPLSSAYPTRCPDCHSPVERYSVFPGGRCLPCHEKVAVPVTDAHELARMWGAS